jgi:hypothetical protein
MRLRIDDYPSGIRPITQKVEGFRLLLSRIDSFDFPFILGIVPALCTELDWKFLAGLRNMVPAMHGITHDYYVYSQLLKEVKDYENNQTVSRQFNELNGINPKYLSDILRSYRNLMRDKLNQEIEIFIPPCNRVTIRQSLALRKAGFRMLYSENKNPFLFLPNFQSSFYGRSDQFLSTHGIATLHITWEYDLYEKWGFSYLDYFMGELTNNRENVKTLRSSRLFWILNYK